jgi:Fe-S oxidoreductase
MTENKTIKMLNSKIRIFPLCSEIKAGERALLQNFGERLSESVDLPENIACCGSGGDKGFFMPSIGYHASGKILWPSDQRHKLENKPPPIICSSPTCRHTLSRQSENSVLSLVHILNQQIFLASKA